MGDKRSCGSCTVCCKVPGIDDKDLQKPVGLWCQYCDNKSARPCTIYETRPDTCKNFECLWLTDDAKALNDDMRPDRSRMMLTTVVGDIGVMPPGAIMAWEVIPGAFDSPRNKKVIDRISNKVPMLLMFLGGGRKIVGPPEAMQEISRKVNQALAARTQRKNVNGTDTDQGE